MTSRRISQIAAAIVLTLPFLVTTILAQAQDQTLLPKCAAPLDGTVRAAIASAYDCEGRSRCIDAQVGRPFDAQGYADGKLPSVSPGSPFHVQAFALQECADLRLKGVGFVTGVVKTQDSNQQGTASTATASATNSAAASAVSSAAQAVSSAQQQVQAATETASGAVSSAVASANAATSEEPKTLCQGAKGPCKLPDQVKLAAHAASLLQTPQDKWAALKYDKLSEQLQDPNLTSERALALRNQYTASQQKIDHANSTIKTALTDMDARLKNELQPHAPDLYNKLSPLVIHAKSATHWSDVESDLSQVASAVTGYQVAKAVPAPASTWPYTVQAGVPVSVREDSVTVPTGDDTAYFTVTTNDSLAGPDKNGNVSGERLWPDDTVAVRVDHGRYYWDFGVLFAGVPNGTSNFSSSTATNPSSYGWAVQSMVVGNVYPAGRQKFLPWAPRHLVPGIQAGVNMDLTKIENAVSLGLIEEPITGLAISGGGMFYARGTAPASSNGTQAMEHVVLPYVGITIDAEFYNSIKAIATPSSTASK